MRGSTALVLLLICFGCTRDIAHIETVEVLTPGNVAAFTRGSVKTEDEAPAHPLLLTRPYEIGKFEISNRQFAEHFNEAIKKGTVRVIEDELWNAASTRRYLSLKNADGSPIGGLELHTSKLVITKDFITASGKKISAENFPVRGVSWYGACAFCNLLSKAAGFDECYDLETFACDFSKGGYRLATEAEWLYAAKGVREELYAWGSQLREASCNYDAWQSPFSGGPSPTGFFNGETRNGQISIDAASPFKAYDMNGNVREWCNDWYGSDWYRYSPSTDPIGPDIANKIGKGSLPDKKVLKGGSYLSTAAEIRNEARTAAAPDDCSAENGFRIARTLLPATTEQPE